MSAPKLIHYFSSHQALLQFWSSTPSDNITLNPVNKEADQSPLDFLTGIGAVANVTHNTEQFISPTRVALVDTIFSL